MKVLITGASGLIGSHLSSFLSTNGHTVFPLSLRGEKRNKELLSLLNNEAFDAVVHLAGENVAQRWTPEKMAAIKDSRIQGTTILCTALSKTNRRPEVLICASGIGFYGNRGNELIDEKSQRGRGFLADVCEEWEEASQIAAKAGIRVVNLRIGVVLSKEGGALAKMLLPFEMGAGGSIGSGQQYMSWIDIDDVVGAIYYIMTNKSLSGPVNIVAPRAVTNAEFTKAFGRVLNRPTLIPIPPFALRLLFGKMADELLIAGQKVIPSKLHASDYKFKYLELEPSLRHVLNK